MISKNGMRFKFSPGEKVLCYEPDPTRSKVLYDSKVLELCISKDKRRKVPEYLIHFSGWSRSWDRCVTEEFILKDNPENRQLQNKLAEAAVGQAKSKKQRRKITAILKDSYRYSKKDDNLSSDVDSDRSKNSDDSDSDSTFGSASDTDQEEPEQEQVMLTLKIPEVLKKKLDEDNHQIKKNNKLVRLPCEPSAIEILEGYVKTYASNELCLTSDSRRSANKKEADISNNINLCKEVMDGLRIYLDFKLDEVLLYNEEQEQYTYFVNNYQPKCPEQTEISISPDKVAVIDAPLGIKVEAKHEEHCPTPSVRGRKPRNSTDTNNSTRPLSPQLSRSPKSPGQKLKREFPEDADNELPKRVLRSTAGKHEGSTPHKSSAENCSNTNHGEKASTSKDSSEEVKECKTPKFGVRSQPHRQAAAIAEALILKSCNMTRSGPSSPLPNTTSCNSTTHSSVGETSSTKTSTPASLPTSTVTTRSHLSSISSCSSKSGPSSPISVPVSSSAALKMTNALNEVMQWRMIPPKVYDQKPVPGSLIYGAVHLLRLFVKLPEMVNQTNMPTEHIQVLESHLELFLSYLIQRQDDFFPLSAYTDATDSTQMQSSTPENSNSNE